MKHITVLLAFVSGCLVLIGIASNDRHRLHSLSFHEGKPRIGFSWEPDAYEPGTQLEVFYTPSLTSSWKLVHTEVVQGEVSDVAYEFADIKPNAEGGFFTVRTYVDSDGDGTSDAREELEFGSNPHSLDSDQDTILDEYEIAHGMNPNDPDTDHDGVTDEFEVAYGTDPLSGDTDGDGIGDFEERHVYGSDPTRRDSDVDGVEDQDEIAAGTDPASDYSQDSRYPDKIMRYFNGHDPYSYPEGSTNRCWEHVFYTGSPEGKIIVPESTDGKAVLKMTVKGVGAGLVKVRGKEYVVFGDEEQGTRSLLAAPRAGVSLMAASSAAGIDLKASVDRGYKDEIIVDAPDSLKVSFTSEDFMIGELPTEAFHNGVHVGWVGFPNTVVKGPCLHWLGERSLELELDPGWELGSEDITCTWTAGGGLNVENSGYRSAQVSGDFQRGSLEEVTYRVCASKYLDGVSEFNQRVRYCLPIEDDEDDDDDDDDDGGTGGEYREDEIPTEEYGGTGWEESDPESGDEEEMEKLLCLTRKEGILLLRDPPTGRELELEVPAEKKYCCGCPEHDEKYVALKKKSSGVKILDESGVEFKRTTVDQKVTVIGLLPSKSINDQYVRFDKCGEVFVKHTYTAIGLGFASTAIDLNVLNAWSYELGLPISVGESISECWQGACRADVTGGRDLTLEFKVGLPHGRVRLEFTNPTGHFQLWRHCYSDGLWRLILDSESCPVCELSVGEWRQLVGIRAGSSGSIPVRVVADAAGQTALKWAYACRSGDEVVCDVVWQPLSAVAPRLVFDYDRNGQIDAADIQAAASGKTFRFWVNDDADADEVEEGLVDLSCENGNAEDSVINGKRDLVDFTPVAVDLTDAFPWNCSSSVREAVTWRIVSDCVNIVQTVVPREKAGAFQTEDMGLLFGPRLSSTLSEATVQKTADGCTLQRLVTKNATQEAGYGVVLMEGCDSGDNLRLEGWLTSDSGDILLMAHQAKIKVSDIDSMYRWINIRETSSGALPVRDGGVPWNWAGAESPIAEDRSFVFVHGFNVNENEARAWASELFKRFWQAGFDGQFVSVDWTGDSSQFHSVLQDDNYAPDYYVNVRNAFKAAHVLPEALAKVSGSKCLLAHSLGNMLVSSAAADHGLSYDRYYMLNAAVPMEAYNASAYAAAMVDTEWSQVPERYWASNWGGLFGGSDFRQSLSWRGRFAGLGSVVNAYSETEDVLGNPTSGQLTYLGGAWKIQELSKGTTTWYDLNALSFGDLDVVCEGGWGINGTYAVNPLWYVYQYGYTKYAGSEVTYERAVTEPLFTRFRVWSDRMHALDFFGSWEIDDPEALRARFLGDAIPATSFAQGANAASDMSGWQNWSLPDLGDHLDAWPRGTPKNGTCEWHHSDIKNLPYFNVHKLFEKIVKGE